MKTHKAHYWYNTTMVLQNKCRNRNEIICSRRFHISYLSWRFVYKYWFTFLYKEHNCNIFIWDHTVCGPLLLISKQKFNTIIKCRYIYISFSQEEFEDTKGVIRIRISKKNRQRNGQKKKDKRTNNDLQNMHLKLKIE